ncbi:HNH endonuclease [Roseibacillus ishigakijimensis]|uniref:HNH endonuclease n=1 Tax=Roseibacillus ishigakijimensis TaxID=454146 RepID=A0A934VN22_9BACT|nr:HNH endonuclease [Roseibacillus ishigakijimensis]MBK1834857.1 HNH endonuclease [Roseibacillus ishigakijimensis]
MKTVIHKSIVLVLNRNWQAINTVTPAEAFAAMMAEGAVGLDIHGPDWMVPVPWEDWVRLPVREDDFAVGTVSGPIRIPLVMVLSSFDRVPLKRPRFSLRGLWQRDGGRCQYTGRVLKAGEGNIDHVIPQSRGGETSWENCVLSDRVVNNRKAARTPQEAGLTLLRRPERPAVVPVTHLLENSYQIAEWNYFLPANKSEDENAQKEGPH